MNDIFTYLFSTPVVSNNEGSISLMAVAEALAFVIVVVVVLRFIRRSVVKKLSKRPGINVGLANSILTITNYLIGFALIWLMIQFLGINLRALAFVFGALSVGIGFGLQNIVNNVVSGLFILLERPVKLGDRAVVDGMEGDIVEIAIRATTVRTNEGVSVIVPNSHFISSSVINRSLDDEIVRYRIPVNVAYGTDPNTIRDVLLQVAGSKPYVLSEPPPVVIFEEFGDSAMKFFLWVWTREMSHKPMVLRSELNFAINEAFTEHGIRIPFPQLDVHVKQPIS
ncbi:MAG: mechanosensitive ion channel [Ignavibacteria bacterium]|nr:mechanosensitive ion channel [Ignavibacteria bacterium]MBK6419805.1 mechanosensitive ion channel [Ignavibacteria bacterium]MBK7413258.1 mechanosensitive ion channel [Ignavibacteria bacterium]